MIPVSNTKHRLGPLEDVPTLSSDEKCCREHFVAISFEFGRSLHYFRLLAAPAQ